MIFEIPGEPQGKGRPRFNGKHAYTPQKTRDYESYVKQCFMAKYGNVEPLKGNVKADIIAVYKIPKSTSKKNRELMLKGEIRPTKKPDADNVAKGVLDSINGLAYIDDKQVVELSVRKWYGEPQVIVEIEEI
jgi:Holliday junction resolvase RusA-like endonuclease